MKVKFVPENKEIEIAPSQSVMELAHQNGVKIKSICNGMPSCAECRIRIVEGEHNVLPPSAKELRLIGTGYYIDQRRLSCQLMCFGDIVVDLEEQLEKVELSDQRRPQGNLRKDDSEISRAKTGNLIEEDEKLLGEVSLSEDKPNTSNKKRRNRNHNKNNTSNNRNRHKTKK